MDNYTNGQFSYYGGNMSPNDYRNEKLAAEKNEKRAIFKNTSFLAILLIIYNILNSAYLYLYFELVYIKYNKTFTTSLNEIYRYLREEQAELISSTAFNMTANLFVVVFSALTVIIVAQCIMKVRVLDMLKPFKGCVAEGVKWSPLAFTLNMLLSLAVSMIVAMLNQNGINVPEADFSINRPSAYALVMQFAYVCLIGPMIEELIYRGLIIKLLSPYGKGMAVFFSALLFGLMHGNISQAFTAFAGGLIYAMVAVRYDSIIPTIVIHVINNVTASIPDFGNAVGVNTDTLYYGILIMMLFFGFYMLMVMLKSLRNDIALSEPQYALSKSRRVSAVFFNIFMVIYLLLFVVVEYISSFISAN